MSLHNAAVKVRDVLYEIDDDQGHVQSIWPDGKCATGVYTFENEDYERAMRLGYGKFAVRRQEVCGAMHREHDLSHHLVMQAMGFPHSLVLRAIAEGTKHPAGFGEIEEHLAFLVQRVSNVGIEGVVRGSQ